MEGVAEQRDGAGEHGEGELNAAGQREADRRDHDRAVGGLSVRALIMA